MSTFSTLNWGQAAQGKRRTSSGHKLLVLYLDTLREDTPARGCYEPEEAVAGGIRAWSRR